MRNPETVITLFRDELGYRFLGDWTDRPGNSNTEDGLLSDNLTKRGYTPAHISRTLDRLAGAARGLGLLMIYELCLAKLRSGSGTHVSYRIYTSTSFVTTLNPKLLDALSGVFELRAATRYRLQYESWQRKDPPRMDRRPVACACNGSWAEVSA